MDKNTAHRIVGCLKGFRIFFLIFVSLVIIFLIFVWAGKKEKMMLERIAATQKIQEALSARLIASQKEAGVLERQIENLRKISAASRFLDLTDKKQEQKETNTARINWQGAGFNPKPLMPATQALSADAQVQDSAGGKNSLARLKKYVSDVELRNADLKEQAVQLESLLHAKEDQIDGLNRDYARLKGDFENILKVQQELKNEMTAQTLALNEQLQSKNNEIESASRIKKDLEKKAAAIQDKMVELEKINFALKDRLRMMIMDSVLMESQLRHIKKELRGDKTTIGSLESKLAEANKELSAAAGERQELFERLLGLEEYKNNSQLLLGETRVEDLLIAVATKDAQIQKGQQEMSLLTDKLESAERQRNELLTWLSEREDTAMTLRKHLGLAKEYMNNNGRRLEDMRQDNLALKKQLRDVLCKLELLKLEAE